MAFIQINMLAQSLMRTVPVNVIIPVDRLAVPGLPQHGDKPYKTLYLLNGVFGNQMDWALGTSICRYAEEHDIAVVMPAGENANYLDHADRFTYYSNFIGKELVDFTRRLFPLSDQREDTYIGGLSMGGYGAMRNGLKYHDTFGAIVALSGAFITQEAVNRKENSLNPLESRAFAEAYFGDLDTLQESDRNPKYLVEELLREGARIPEIYMACGLQDSFLANNNDMAEFLRQKGIPITYETAPGAHEWTFWDRFIEKALDWLPTEAIGQGINSGNVGI